MVDESHPLVFGVVGVHGALTQSQVTQVTPESFKIGSCTVDCKGHGKKCQCVEKTTSFYDIAMVCPSPPMKFPSPPIF